jgi:hypothetical protein
MLIEGGATAITSDANLGAPQGGITFADCYRHPLPHASGGHTSARSESRDRK